MRRALIALGLLVTTSGCHHARPTSIPTVSGERYVFEFLDTGRGFRPNRGVRFELTIDGDHATLVTNEYLGPDGTWFWLDGTQRARWQVGRTGHYDGVVHRNDKGFDLELAHALYACESVMDEAAVPTAVMARTPQSRDTSSDMGPGCFDGLAWSPAGETPLRILDCKLRTATEGGPSWDANDGWMKLAPAPGVQMVHDANRCHSGVGSSRLRRL